MAARHPLEIELPRLVVARTSMCGLPSSMGSRRRRSATVAASARPWCRALLVLALAGCAAAQPPTVASETRAEAGVPPLELDPAALPSEPGSSEAHWEAGGTRTAGVWMPERSRPRTLVILLHGALSRGSSRRQGQPRSVVQRLVTCLAEPALRRLDPLIIAPYSVDGRWWQRADTEFVLGLVRAAQQRWPELGRRSVIMGYSNGGIATWYFARLYPEYFAAAIPMAFDDTIVGASPLPIFAIAGQKDELFAIGPVRDAIAAVKASGADVTLTERYRTGHMNPCAYARELGLAAVWLEQHAFPGALGGERASPTRER